MLSQATHLFTSEAMKGRHAQDIYTIIRIMTMLILSPTIVLLSQRDFPTRATITHLNTLLADYIVKSALICYRVPILHDLHVYIETVMLVVLT